MARAAVATGMELEYETLGSADGPALLPVMGFTAHPREHRDELIEGSHLFVVADVGHDLPLPLVPLPVDVISAFTANT